MDPLDLIERGKIHRFFRATRKLNAPEVVSHVTQRAAGKEPAFVEDGDYLAMLGILKDVTKRYNLRVFAFCLMPNHVHLLFGTTESNLWDAMRDLFSRYARAFNKKYERRGHLFGGPYRQAVCLDDSYLLAASLYIHLNPVRSAIVRDVSDYAWSSCRLYCEERPQRSFVDTGLILGLLGRTRAEGKMKYMELLQRGAELDTGPVLEQADAIEKFQFEMLPMFNQVLRRIRGARRLLGLGGNAILDLETIEKRIEEMTRNGVVNNAETRRARRYLVEQLLARGFTREEIARKLGVSRKTVYNLLRPPSQERSW